MKFVHSLVINLRKATVKGFLPSNTQYFRNLSSQKSKVRVEDLFINSEVQRILKKITGKDYDKIFASKPTFKIDPHEYVFATDEKLKELQNAADAKASVKLHMPPVVEVRKPIDEILSKDPELQGYVASKLVFIDTSPDVYANDRVIVVRETDGTLRKANWEERDRMIEIFYPKLGKYFETPPLFFSPNIERLLDEGSYVFLLDMACCQFVPDHPEYHRVTHTTYDHVNQTKKFDILRSTRHFGPMAFYLAYNKNIDDLLMDMIERGLISDASDTIKLFYILNPDVENISKNEKDEIKIIQDYIKNYSKETGNLELRLQTYFELQLQPNENQEAIA